MLKITWVGQRRKSPLKRGTSVLTKLVCYICILTVRMQHDWSYATVTNRMENRMEINWPGTDASKTLYILRGLSKNQQVLLMQCTVCFLWCKRSVKLYGLQGAHVLPLMLKVCIYKLSVLICAISFLWLTKCANVIVAFIHGKHNICTAWA